MATMAEALADTSGLMPYKGRDVIRTSIAIRNAGDGLSQAMAIQPVELELGSRVFVVLECEVAHQDYGFVKDTDCLELKQVLRAEGATLVDEDLVREHLDAQAERIEEARIAAEEARGIQRLPYEGTDELMLEHEKCQHSDELVDGCPECAAEREAEEDGD